MPDSSVIPASFPAVFVAEPDGTPSRLVEATSADLGDGDVVIEVAYSSLNYKDGLALTGTAPVVRRFPMIGGIDLAGRVVASESDRVHVGDEVVVTGWGLGEEHPGGYSLYARVPGIWCERLPASMSMHAAVIIGTAGITAMLSIMALERNRSGVADLEDLPLLVTGASGGVGSLAVLLCARLGYRVAASTGRVNESEFLHSLGASEVVDRRELSEMEPSALGKVRFGAGIDSVGGTTLSNLIRVTRPGGTVTSCGNAGGADLDLTVYPFILRGVTLAGVNSVRPLANDRPEAWRRISAIVSDSDFEAIARDIPLSQVIEVAPTILRGDVRGRIAVVVR
jgi:acrylyl-CoA reductase (NADPH)